MNEWSVLFATIVLGIVLFVVGSGHAERECAARGGWYTQIGGYPTCLPPGSKP